METRDSKTGEHIANRVPLSNLVSNVLAELGGLEIGEAIHYQNLTMLPLHGKSPVTEQFTLLAAAHGGAGGITDVEGTTGVAGPGGEDNCQNNQ